MNIPEDCTFTYIVSHEAWYSAAAHRGDRRHVLIQAAAKDGGVAWEFQVEAYDDLGGHPALRLMMFDDSWDAFVHVPELFAALQAERPTTLPALRALLDQLGATDITDRETPAKYQQVMEG